MKLYGTFLCFDIGILYIALLSKGLSVTTLLPLYDHRVVAVLDLPFVLISP